MSDAQDKKNVDPENPRNSLGGADSSGAPNEREVAKTQKTPQNLQPEQDNLIGRNEFLSDLSKILEHFIIGNPSIVEKAQLFPYAFNLEIKHIDMIESIVRRKMLEPKSLKVDGVVFEAIVRNSDLTIENFTDINELKREAGNEQDPERLVMTWKLLLLEPLGGVASVEASFTTEKTLDIEEQSLLTYYTSSMKLEVKGEKKAWVDDTFRSLRPTFVDAKISGLYKPLLAFRNATIVIIFSFALASIMQSLWNHWLSDIVFYSKPVEMSSERNSALESILKEESIQKKVDSLARWILTPSSYESPVEFPTSVILKQSISWTIYLGSIFLGYFIFPKLVPTSSINIGYAAERHKKRDSVYRFVIFNVIIFGIAIRFLFKYFFQY